MNMYIWYVCVYSMYIWYMYVYTVCMYVYIACMYMLYVCIYMYVCNISLANLLPIGIKIIMVVLKTRARPIWVIQ